MSIRDRHIQTAIRLAMDARGLTAGEVCQRTGMAHRTFNDVASGTRTSRRGRRKIELLLGPLWSSPREMAATAEMAAKLGFDPVLASNRQLYAWARDHILTRPLPDRRAPLLAVIEKHFSSEDTTTEHGQR